MEKCSKSTLRLFERALIDNTNEIEVFGINTAQFFVECSLERAKRLSNYSKKFIILKPFLTEQFASFLNRKRCAFKLYQASIDYNELKCYEHSHMCMMTAFNLINENGFELLKTELLKGLFKVYPDGRYPLKKILGERLLSDPSFLQKVLRVNPPNEVVNCGFIQTRVVRFVSKGFAATVPDGYSESWPKTAQQLFGAFRNGEFFNYNALKVLECSGNEPLIIDVFCKSNCPIFHFKNVKIEAECDFELKQKAQEIEGENSLIRFEVYTKGNGIINFKGLTFDWENIHFRSCFSNNDIIFQSYIEASSVKLDVELPKDQLYIGEIIQIKCTLTNSEIPLKHLGMVVSGSIKFSVNSDTDEICGQRFLTPLQPNEKCEITISVVGESPGEYDLFLIFPFWSSKPPVRYVSHHITFVIRSFSDYYIKSINNQLRCEAPPSFEAIGFSSSLFDVSYHTSIIGKTKAVLDFISTSSDRVELVLPSYCESFSDGDEQIRFWCRSDCSFLFMPFFCSENCFVGLISHIDRSLYSIEFRNISNVGIKDFKVSIVEPNERITFIVSGNQIKSIDVLMPEQSIKYRVNILRLTEEVNLLLMVSGELFSVYKSVSLNK
ncbi:hypothetical protein GPJ56_000650 [Histomonas meleagridis]|uniref:uncharacterized protein n=1 Tax=Histomonas meleagridis TaxID=135588 RepID=UPI00355A9972|nr:hypothetical protein GPJ56_000650 [Histomonas meleagridis]KAH0804779.1 hypothetical protein GO595_002473 [Histomonas meleagridis]